MNNRKVSSAATACFAAAALFFAGPAFAGWSDWEKVGGGIKGEPAVVLAKLHGQPI